MTLVVPFYSCSSLLWSCFFASVFMMFVCVFLLVFSCFFFCWCSSLIGSWFFIGDLCGIGHIFYWWFLFVLVMLFSDFGVLVAFFYWFSSFFGCVFMLCFHGLSHDLELMLLVDLVVFLC